MGHFETVIGKIRRGLNPGAGSEPESASNGAPSQAVEYRALDAAALRAQFIAALSAVGGHPIEVADETGATQRLSELFRTIGVRSAAIGAGITTDTAAVATRLAADGYEVTTIGQPSESIADLKRKLSEIDAGIVEADYAIASTGTLAQIGVPTRPRVISLLPPTSVVLLRAARILPDLAAVLSAVGPQTIAAHPMVLVTGPSRTADIEKRIVIGVHGPKELYVMIIADGGPAAG